MTLISESRLSASRLNSYLGCQHQAALWLAGIKAEEAADPTIELVRAKGFEHEEKVLNHLKALYGAVAEISTTASYADREKQTQEAIAAKVPLIVQAALVLDHWQGFPDFLIGRETPNGFAYEPEDAKLARHPKGEHLLQLGIYAGLLQKLYGVPVRGGTIHVAQGNPVSFDLRRTQYILRRLINDFEGFVARDERTTVPVPCTKCKNCDYKPRCDTEWRAADSPYYVAGLTGAQVVKLAASGVNTLAQLADLKPGSAIDGIGNETLAKLISQARLQKASRETGIYTFAIYPIVPGRGFANLPPSDPGDLFFDMEGDPLAGDGLEYLFGIYGRLGTATDPSFKPFWGHNVAEEKAAFEDTVRLFIDQLTKHPKAHIYHYAAYEVTALKRLAMRHATMESEVDYLLRERRFVDLYRIVIQAMQASTESYSLKDIEKIYGRGRSGEVTTAAGSIVEYENWCTTRDPKILDAIERYNEEDCVSTGLMRDWLESLRPVNGYYNPVQADWNDEEKRDQDRAFREQRKNALAARVRASGIGDERLREVLAELLWFHQRAHKPGWWAAFERQQWSDEELIDDPESLGGLERDVTVPVVQVKKSLDTAYRFTPQDTKLKVGDEPKIAETLKRSGTIVALDAENGTAVLRRGTGSGAMPDKLNLISTPINLLEVPEAVFSFIERATMVAAKTDAAIFQLLARAHPRLRGRKVGEVLCSEGHNVTGEVIRAIEDLDHSYLIVQGPPGTGKTYTSARAIVALLRAGKRVGVSSNSHKAIGKLLEEVELFAAETGFRFAGAKRGSTDKPETHFDSKNIATITKSDGVKRNFQLVGGTVFHFSRQDQVGQFDYLFVDEAGQVALGNLVAMGPCASNIVLIGDQMQLPQPVQGVHPGETGLSCLEYLLQKDATVPQDRGILLNVTRRMHPKLCSFISEAIYDGRLRADPVTSERSLVLGTTTCFPLKPAGLSFFPIKHEGCTQSSREEASAILGIVTELLAQKVTRQGKHSRLTIEDVLIIAPYNLQVNLLKQMMPSGTKIGTIDKFQGQEAPVVIVSMTTSRGTDAPRGTEFLFNPNRFNVAISRAQCLAIVVHGAELLDGASTKVDDLYRLNLFAHGEAVSHGG